MGGASSFTSRYLDQAHHSVHGDQRANRFVPGVRNRFVGTRGGPQNSTTTFVLLIYNEAFGSFQFGRAAAMAVILAVIILSASYFQFRWFASQVEY